MLSKPYILEDKEQESTKMGKKNWLKSKSGLVLVKFAGIVISPWIPR